MSIQRGNLKPAHSGYRYQDIATAYLLVRALVERYDHVIVDRKRVLDDRIDDVEVSIGGVRIRRQFKSSENPQLRLTSNDFLASNSSLRFDGLVLTHVRSGTDPANEYRLCATWQPPASNDDLLKFLTPTQAAPTFLGATPRFFRLMAELIWPQNGVPAWSVLDLYAEQGAEFGRQDVVDFCERFVIELELPLASKSLTAPGLFEHQLLDLLTSRVGIGRYPNHGRHATDVAALAISLATLARTQEAQLTPADVARELEIRTDFGRVAQAFPIDATLFHDRPDFRRTLFESALAGGMHVVVAGPGAGKSWELTRLADELKAADIIVARHYCYLEPGDEYVERRITTDVFFGNLLGDLSDAFRERSGVLSVGFSSGLTELEQALEHIADGGEYRVVLIVDGLDHIARVRSASRMLSDDETDIVERLATLAVPEGVAVVIGSQPGVHLDPLRARWRELLIEHAVPAWRTDDIVALAKRHGVEAALTAAGFSRDAQTAELLTQLSERADGNPLYARYLASGLIAGLEIGQIASPEQWLSSNPDIQGDIAVYYSHLYANASQQAKVIADLMGVIDFSVSASELQEIVPLLGGWLHQGLLALSPVLTASTGQGGVRIFHESFRRFMMDELTRQGRSLTDVLAPVIAWLEQRGFFADAKSYRFLLPALRRAGRTDDVLSYIPTTFVADSVSHAHPLEAIQKNLALAADIAGRNRNWSFLVRCVELRRALSTCFDVGQNPWPQFWATYVELYGATALAERLLFDGRPTQSRDNGLLACKLVDDRGGTAPWREYLELPVAEDASIGANQFDKNGALSDDETVGLAALQGRLRLGARFRVLKKFYSYLCNCQDEFKPMSVRRASALLARLISAELVEKIAARADPTRPRGARISVRAAAALRLGIADEYARQQDAQRAKAVAATALATADSPETAISCLELGAPAADACRLAQSPSSISIAVAPNEHLHDAAGLRRWVASVRLLATTSNGNAILDGERTRIAGVGWYRCWLRYVLNLGAAEAARRADEPYDIFAVFSELTRDVAPFRGEPRPCDLYAIHGVIQETLALGLTLLQTTREWEFALQAMSVVSEGTGSRLDREDGGPVPIGTLIALLMPYIGVSEAAIPVRTMIERKVEECHAIGAYYAIHAEYTMYLAQMQARTGEPARAATSWRQAGTFFAGYGWHKDITLFDLIESAAALTARSHGCALSALCQIQPLIAAVLRHTDGRETKRTPNAWFGALLKVFPSQAIELLARTLLEDDGVESWPTVQALEDVTSGVIEQADPLLVDALWETIPFEVEYENQSGAMADKRLATLRRLSQEHPIFVRQRFQRLWAEVANDGRRHTGEAIARLEAFADEMGLPAPLGATSQRGSEEVSVVGKSLAADISKVAAYERSEPVFPPEPALVDLLAGLRKAGQRKTLSSPQALSDVVLSLSYRLGEMVDNGHEADARRLLHFFVHDIGLTAYGELHPLSDLAEALDNAGYASLATLGYALAYTATRGGGGWLSFGDHRHGFLLQRAVKINRGLAQQTVADEVAYRLRHVEYGAGISRHLVERMVEWGEPAEAERAWNEAFAVIASRLPLPGERGWFAVLDVDHLSTWSVDEALIALLLVRLAEPRRTRKVAALAGFARTVRHRHDAVAAPLRWWLSRDTHTSSLTLALAVLLEAEEQPYAITTSIQDLLVDYAKCDCFGARLLCAMLLKRAGSPVPPLPMPHSISEEVPTVTDRELQLLNLADSGDTLSGLSSIWPDLRQRIARRLYEITDGNEVHRKRSQERVRLSYGRDGDAFPPTPVLHWLTEVFLAVLHGQLTGLKEQLWRNGSWTDNVEQEVLMQVLPDSSVHISLAASRTVRPPWEKPNDLANGCEMLASVPNNDSSYAGWTRLAIVERQFVDDQNRHYGRPTHTIILFSGAVVARFDGSVPRGAFPFTNGDPIDWWLAPDSSEIIQPPSEAQIVRLARVKDWLGDVFVFIPPAVLRRYVRLQSPAYSEPLAWRDLGGSPAVVLRTWRIRNEKIYDAEPVSIEGSDLIVRPDMLDLLQRLCTGPLRQLQVVTRSAIEL